ncbi:hypothetical protein ACFXHA_10250 [Nocardia sp. NPDC059240]|uniref:hypothetical protein n=1 Tax=Nocardia sp. NPDC059240 TaxID=3346786 RepID=UPI0036CBD7F5
MLPANENDSRISLWLRVREYAVPPSMIETATARRLVGDWGGACAAAGFDVDIHLRALARTHGRALATRVRSDLRYLAPDLLRWHMPRIAPDGLLRPGLTLTLARYRSDDETRCDSAGPVHLVVRTAPAWADAGQRISLSLWDESGTDGGPHPHATPDRRFRLDLHRHLWDARRSDELRIRSGAAQFDANPGPVPEFAADAPPGSAVGRWAAEAAELLHDTGDSTGPLLIRLGSRHHFVVELRQDSNNVPALDITPDYPRGLESALPMLPHAATWTPPDLELLRANAITPDRLHPLVAAALAPNPPPSAASLPSVDSSSAHSACATTPPSDPRVVECRGARHRIGLRGGVLTALDHPPEEIRREELLVALSGTPLPCLQAIDRAHRHPDCLAGVRERLSHGDIGGALAVVEELLGPGAALREGALRDALEAAARRRITYGLFRAGLTGFEPRAPRPPRPPHRTHPRHATRD